MGYKVKSTGIPWRIIEGTNRKMACEVTFTLTGTDEVVRNVYGSGVNVVEYPADTNLLAAIRMNLKAAVVAECQALDAEAVETTAMTNQKTLLQTALTSSGWWFAILIAFLLWMMPLTSWAGTLAPAWDATTTTITNGLVGKNNTQAQNTDTYAGVLDLSTKYSALICINLIEYNDNIPAGAGGVSIYAIGPEEYASGTTLTGAIGPIAVFEVSNTEYTKSSAGAGAGVTKWIKIENVPYLYFTISKGQAADFYKAFIREIDMDGSY